MRSADANASEVGWRETDGPEAVGQVEDRDAWGSVGARVELEDGPNLKEGGEAKFRGRGRAVGIESLHVDDEGHLGGAFAFDKSLCVREAWVEGHQARREEGIKHALDEGALGGLLRGSAGISKEEAPRGSGEPDFRGNGDTTCRANAFGGH